MSTKRIRLVVAYDGTDYHGWAAQRDARTVQSTLTDTVRRVSGEEIEITGASRTDAGAHARGQVCHFDTANPMPPEKWTRVLNRLLPLDLSVRRSDQVSEAFHSRFAARDRFYRYRILLGERDPIRGRYAHHYGRAIDAEKMRQAATRFLGRHDFRAFSEELMPGTNTEREVFRLDVRPVRDEVWIDVTATAFVRGMMRRIAGSLLEVGRGHRPIESIERLLDPERRDDEQWPVVLPARGLTLMRVRYGRHPRDHREETI